MSALKIEHGPPRKEICYPLSPELRAELGKRLRNAEAQKRLSAYVADDSSFDYALSLCMFMEPDTLYKLLRFTFRDLDECQILFFLNYECLV